MKFLINHKNIFARYFIFILILCAVIFSFANDSEAAKKKKRYDDWRGVAADMALEFNSAIEDVQNDKYQDAYKHVNDAYFKYYEVQGVESTVMYAISAARVNHIEAQFRDIKHVLLGNQEKEKNLLMQQIEDLKIKVYKDSMVLDGKAEISDPDSVGLAIYTDTKVEKPVLVASAKNETQTEIPQPQTQVQTSTSKTPVNRDWLTFVTAFGLLVREGLEAILVIVAIVAYLIKTGNKNMLKGVYLGSFAAIIASVILAWALDTLMGEQSGVARELLEGWTMFLAVAVLFYVSNWMLSKADTIAWENYISGKVQQSIDSKSQWTLIFAAFIAVMREGAELILFYSAAFTGGMSNPAYIAYGIGAGILVLVAVWVAFRYFSVKLPLRAFFMFTSILLFLMCISFMGKGVVELTEADVISGRTVIPAMKGFSIEILSIYDRAETLIPQIMLVIAALWIMIPHMFRKKDKSK
ncbi:MAG: FTR1 family iron permease [Synergistaceae bacterium]|nr:FTR1 family iron permease [Synergistaceae bacterium]MBR0079928.1 FTR1 family iron permease [Synergistaceae bacterium]